MNREHLEYAQRKCSVRIKFMFMRTYTGLKVHYDMLIPKHNATNTADKAPCFLTLGIRRRRIDTLSVRQWPEIAQSVLRLAKEWMVRESNVGGGRYFPRQTITALGLTQPPAQ